MNIFNTRSSKLLRPAILIGIICGGILSVNNTCAQDVLHIPKLTIKAIQSEIDKGDAAILYIAGSIYYNGTRGTKPDYRKAEEFFTRAAEQGIALAQLHLGVMYFEGTKIPQNDAKAFRWYQVAALQGIPKAEYGLGVIYEEGRGTDKNTTNAARWYELAARQGYAEAQNKLGVMYENGTGVRQDPVTAYKWLSLAATQNIMEAVGSRDEVRKKLSKENLSRAQRKAAAFKPIPHYNTAELNRQSASIIKRAKNIDIKKR
jgi:TPR repeat protein